MRIILRYMTFRKLLEIRGVPVRWNRCSFFRAQSAPGRLIKGESGAIACFKYPGRRRMADRGGEHGHRPQADRPPERDLHGLPPPGHRRRPRPPRPLLSGGLPGGSPGNTPPGIITCIAESRHVGCNLLLPAWNFWDFGQCVQPIAYTVFLPASAVFPACFPDDWIRQISV